MSRPKPSDASSNRVSKPKKESAANAKLKQAFNKFIRESKLLNKDVAKVGAGVEDMRNKILELETALMALKKRVGILEELASAVQVGVNGIRRKTFCADRFSQHAMLTEDAASTTRSISSIPEIVEGILGMKEEVHTNGGSGDE